MSGLGPWLPWCCCGQSGQWALRGRRAGHHFIPGQTGPTAKESQARIQGEVGKLDRHILNILPSASLIWLTILITWFRLPVNLIPCLRVVEYFSLRWIKIVLSGQMKVFRFLLHYDGYYQVSSWDYQLSCPSRSLKTKLIIFAGNYLIWK